MGAGGAYTMADERRKSKRVSLRARCWCEGKTTTLFIQIHDASLGGLFLKTHVPFNPGERVTVRWKFPESKEEHYASMAVVWKRAVPNPPGMGLKFLDVSDQTIGVLRKIVEKDSSKRSPAS